LTPHIILENMRSINNKTATIFSIFCIIFIIFLNALMFYEMYIDNAPTDNQKEIEEMDRTTGNFGLNNYLPKGNGTWGTGTPSP